MNDRTTNQIPKSSCDDGDARQSLCLVGGETICGNRYAGRSAKIAYSQDAAIKRLRKLRDYYRQTSQPLAVKAIERAILVLREMM